MGFSIRKAMQFILVDKLNVQTKTVRLVPKSLETDQPTRSEYSRISFPDSDNCVLPMHCSPNFSNNL